MDLYLSDNLRYLRNKRGLSQEQLAKKLDITRNKVVSYETSKVEPKLSLILNMSKFFKIRVSSLLGKKISDANYEAQIEYFHMKLSDLLEHEPAVGTNIEVEEELIEQFVDKVYRMTSVYKGVSSLMKFRKKRGQLDPNTEDMMMIIDEIQDINKRFISKMLKNSTENKKLQEILNEI